MSHQTVTLSLEHYGATSPSQKIIPMVGGGRGGGGGAGYGMKIAHWENTAESQGWNRCSHLSTLIYLFIPRFPNTQLPCYQANLKQIERFGCRDIQFRHCSFIIQFSFHKHGE